LNGNKRPGEKVPTAEGKKQMTDTRNLKHIKGQAAAEGEARGPTGWYKFRQGKGKQGRESHL